MSRGGARRKAKAYVDPSLLLQVMGNHGDLLADQGSYERRNKQGAVDPAGRVVTPTPEASSTAAHGAA